jgi:hypothetical protein
MIHKEATEDGQVWPPILGLYKSVVVALTYMRRNRVQAELAETYDVSQSTISRAISGITPLLGKAVSIGHGDTVLRDQLIEDLDRLLPA